MEIRTNEEVLEWYKNTLENGKVSEETIKREALKFFKISPDAAKDKKRFKIEVEHFVTKHKKLHVLCSSSYLNLVLILSLDEIHEGTFI